MKKELIIEGMSCNHCVNRVVKALEAIAGVKAEVTLSEKKAVVTSLTEISDETLIKVVDEAGYDVVKIV